MKFIFLLLFPLFTQASWQLGSGTGAYLGAFQLQSQWESETRMHFVYFSYGITRDQIIRDIQQYSMAYQWSPFEIHTRDRIWDPVMVGIFGTYSDNPYYYFNSHARYNNDYYYDVTNFRWGMRLSSQLMVLNMGPRPVYFALDGSLLEKGLFAFFNNPDELDIFKFYWSLGLSVRIEL